MKYLYHLRYTPADAAATHFAGGRYSWSEALAGKLDPEGGILDLRESEAWDVVEAVEEDDAFCPLLSPVSLLYSELRRLTDEVV